VSQAQAASQTDQQTKALIKRASSRVARARGEEVRGDVREDRRAAGLREERPAATVWLNYGLRGSERARHEVRDQAYDAFLKLAPRRRERAAGAQDREAAQGPSKTTDALIDIETTPDGATLVSVSAPLDYGLVADLAEALAKRLGARGPPHRRRPRRARSMDESAVGVLAAPRATRACAAAGSRCAARTRACATRSSASA